VVNDEVHHANCTSGRSRRAESFFAILEAELLSRRRFASQAEAKMACFSYIEGWYNQVRLLSALGYRSPMAYEATMQTAEADT
jgi:putative transposase